MTYHEDFWIAVAASAPVVALGHAVFLERATRRVGRLTPDERRGWDDMRDRLTWLLVGAVVLEGALLLFNGAAFAVALTSLWQGKDPGSTPGRKSALAVGAGVALTAGLLVVPLVIKLLDWVERPSL
jgi:hypothetical protein